MPVSADAPEITKGNLTSEDLLQSDLLPFTPVVALWNSEDGEWYYILTYGYGGWVKKEAVAFCESRDDWLNRMHCTDFLVTLDYEMHVEFPDKPLHPELADVSIPMGSILPVYGSENGTYTVLLPARNESGCIDDVVCTLPAEATVFRGYLPYTEENIRILAEKHIGHAYGNAGSNNAFDCSGMTRSIYACFGYVLPRSAVAQSSVDVAKIYNVHNDLGLGFTLDIGHNTVEYKMKVLEDAPVGTLLYFPGHIMMYLGMENGHPMCISAVATYCTKDLPVGTVVDVNETVITDMTYITRATGKTWLEALEKIIIIK